MRRPDVRRVDPTRAVALGAIAAIVGVQLVFFGLPFGLWLHGLVLGGLNAVLAVGMALIYRANRVVNFAQAELGTAPAAFAAAFVLFWGWPYLLGLAAGLVMAIVAGVVVEFALIRRFRNSPRLVVTVATLGITQLLLVIGILIPRWWGRNLASERIAPPVGWKLTVGQVILNANHFIALVVSLLMMAGVAWFLARNRYGLAIRASAERGDRAAMLGIPIGRLNTLVWAIAAAMSYVALFLRSGIIGVPLGYAAGLPTLLQALAALVIGRLERLPTVATAAIALGLLESGVRFNSDTPAAAYPIMALVMFVVLLVQRTSSSRLDNDASSTWRGAEEVRPLADAERCNVRVRVLRWAVILAGMTLVVGAPFVLRVDYIIKTSAIFAFAIIGLSLVVLTGWAGQISLGQMAIVGIGAAVSATCTSRWHVDLTLGLLIGGCAGGVVAFAVGVPALRLRGLYLAVTTFALGLATEQWLLSDRFFGWFPNGETRFERPPLFGKIGVDTPVRYYLYSLVVLTLAFLATRGIRHSRTGRVIIAVRENERAAQSYSVPAVRAKLTAFVISGVLAGIGGALYAHLNQSFSVSSYNTGESFSVFTSAVIGGLGSLGGALLGAAYLRGVRWFIPSQEWQLLSSGAGVLLVLLILPGGLGSLWITLRDLVVRRLVRRSPRADAEAVVPAPVAVEPAT
ncbi:MAG TPA: ABC transporter permease [Ilumatobacteraceae bacterium]|nr:ABC transporter permease [Ilumatobacteraceae bacterium]